MPRPTTCLKGSARTPQTLHTPIAHCSTGSLANAADSMHGPKLLASDGVLPPHLVCTCIQASLQCDLHLRCRILKFRRLKRDMRCRFLDLGKETRLLLPHVIKEELDKIAGAHKELKTGPAYEMMLTGQEAIVSQGKVAIALRPDIGLWKHITVDPSNMKIQEVEASRYLELKETLSGQCKLLQALSSAKQAQQHLTSCTLIRSLAWRHN